MCVIKYPPRRSAIDSSMEKCWDWINDAERRRRCSMESGGDQFIIETRNTYPDTKTMCLQDVTSFGRVSLECEILAANSPPSLPESFSYFWHNWLWKYRTCSLRTTVSHGNAFGDDRVEILNWVVFQEHDKLSRGLEKFDFTSFLW